MEAPRSQRDGPQPKTALGEGPGEEGIPLAVRLGAALRCSTDHAWAGVDLHEAEELDVAAVDEGQAERAEHERSEAGLAGLADPGQTRAHGRQADPCVGEQGRKAPADRQAGVVEQER